MLNREDRKPSSEHRKNAETREPKSEICVSAHSEFGFLSGLGCRASVFEIDSSLNIRHSSFTTVPAPLPTQRLFVALELPEAVRAPLRSVLAVLQRSVPARAVRWVRAENIHLTLRFLGNVSSDAIPELCERLKQSASAVPAFDLRLGDPGCFPNHRLPRVLWVGLTGGLEPLADLQRRVCEATADWGEREAYGFYPHLTLGRVNTRRRDELASVAHAMSSLRLPASEPWKSVSCSLMQSELAPGGSIYTRIAEISLASQAGAPIISRGRSSTTP